MYPIQKFWKIATKFEVVPFDTLMRVLIWRVSGKHEVLLSVTDNRSPFIFSLRLNDIRVVADALEKHQKLSRASLHILRTLNKCISSNPISSITYLVNFLKWNALKKSDNETPPSSVHRIAPGNLSNWAGSIHPTSWRMVAHMPALKQNATSFQSCDKSRCFGFVWQHPDNAVLCILKHELSSQ